MNRSDDPCAICAYAKAHGSWPPSHKGTHCKDCHASWSGIGKAHCTVCHQTFASNAAADHHWNRERHVDPGLTRNTDGTPKLERDDDGIWHTAIIGNQPAFWRGAA